MSPWSSHGMAKLPKLLSREVNCTTAKAVLKMAAVAMV